MPKCHPRKLILLFASLLWLASSLSLTAAPVTQLKVLTFNIWKQGGLSLSNCMEVIRSTGADLVGLQECNDTTARTIATNLGFYVLPVGDSSIVSRFPIVATYIAGNSSGVTVQLSPNQRAHFFNCHPPAYPYGPYDLQSRRPVSDVLAQEASVRLPAVKQLLAAMQPFLSGADPCFLTGDFNAPSHLDYAAVAWPTSLACLQAGLKDSYRELHADNRTYPLAFAYNDPGITWTPKVSQEPNGVFDRIDFVYYAPRSGVAASASVELDERNSVDPWPSDHRAVLTTFSLTPPTPSDKATLPAPANQSTNMALSFNLLWLAGNHATSHSVYMGTNGPTLLVTNTSASNLALTNLTQGTTYFWRVDETTPSGVVTGDVWSFTTRATAIYEWNFAKGSLAPSLGQGVFDYADGAVTSNLTSLGTTDGSLVPHINGVPATYLRAPAFSGNRNGYYLTFPDSQPNGGGQYINQYTLIMDVLLPSPLTWCALFNTSTANTDDAELYINSSGAIGIGAVGYSAAGAVKNDAWQRLAVAADLAAGTVRYFVNGSLVRTGSAGLDSRFSIFSTFDPGPDLLLFNEGDTSGVYTHQVLLHSLCFLDRTLTAAEIQALGGPKARGILASAPPMRLSLKAGSDNLVLNWTGGNGPFQVQKSTCLSNAPAWENVGSSRLNATATLTNDSVGAFFRVIDQGL
jgi:endonuclease/exonuclease/phosphatase family metal-dependent hydrolase